MRGFRYGERLPQRLDRVEVVRSHCFGTIILASVRAKGGIYSFFVRLDDTFCGWYEQDELRVVGHEAPASDPLNYG